MNSNGTGPGHGRSKWTPSMSVALGLGLGFFVLTSVAGVLGVGLVVGYQNTVDLLAQKAELIIAAQRDQTTRFMSSASNQVEFISEQISRGEVTPGESEEFVSLLLGALSATPQIVRLQYIDEDYRLTGAERRDGEAAPIFQRVGGDDDLKRLVDETASRAEAYWGALLWRQEYGQAVLNFQMPVHRGGARAGVLSAWISVTQISEFLSDLQSDFGANAYVLHGRDQVLAHPLMAFGYPGLNRARPLPEQHRFSDPVVSAMWSEADSGSFAGWFLNVPNGKLVSFGNLEYIILFEDLEGFAPQPFVIATYFQAHDMTVEIVRLKWAIIFCLAMAVVSAAIAAFIGRQIATPVRRLADGAKKIQKLNLASVDEIPGSFFRELDDAAKSFNVMLEGLRWFERYVPKGLAMRLMDVTEARQFHSTHREVAVMFSDIVGFTTLSEELSAPDTAAFLNEHLSVVAGCVESEEGTVDKFIGDNVMAFWGAPVLQLDAAERACRCALAITDALGAMNDARQTRDADAERVRMRIGIHLGRAVVGNIGSSDRINYTVVGDTVNVANRLEQVAKELGQAYGDVSIFVSGPLHDALPADFRCIALGAHVLRGREGPVEIHQLVGMKE